MAKFDQICWLGDIKIIMTYDDAEMKLISIKIPKEISGKVKFEVLSPVKTKMELSTAVTRISDDISLPYRIKNIHKDKAPSISGIDWVMTVERVKYGYSI